MTMKTPLRRGLAMIILALAFWTQLAPVNAAPLARRDGPAEATRVHVVLLGYTPHNDFGNACRKDIIAIEAALREGFGDKADRLAIHDLSVRHPRTDRHYTGEEVEQYLRDMDIGDNDIVVVFHSGHGGIADRNDPEGSHVLNINGGAVRRGTIMRHLQAKNPRGLIVLTDCCSSYAATEMDNLEFVSLNAAVTINAETIQNLFLRMRGVISLTAAQDGTSGLIGYSGGNPADAGSAFTVGMLRLTYTERTYTSWKDFFGNLSDEVHAASTGIGGRPHRPRYFHMTETR